MSVPTPRRPRLVSALLVALVAVLLTGCAHFPDSGPRNWRDKPDSTGLLAAPPKVPDQDPDKDQAPSEAPTEPAKPLNRVGCDDPDPLVVATCLDPVSSIAVLPDGEYALVAQRATGRILKIAKGKPTVEVAVVPVNAAGGGLKAVVLSPYYAEDHLVYAYAAGNGDNRLVRVTLDGQVTPVLTGIPSAPGNDSGSLAVDRAGALVIATAAVGGADSGSLAGKILRVDTFGHPFKGNPNPGSPIYSSGLNSPGGLCIAADNGSIWVTDRRPDKDALFKVGPGPLGDPAWNWPDKPGVAGCVAAPDNVVVAERGAGALYLLQKKPNSDTFTGVPNTALAGTYGHLSAATIGSAGVVWLGTENQGRGKPIASSDDRVIRLPLIGGGGSGSGPD